MRRFTRGHQRLTIALLLVALACLLLVPTAALARAGGGHTLQLRPLLQRLIRP